MTFKTIYGSSQIQFGSKFKLYAISGMKSGTGNGKFDDGYKKASVSFNYSLK